jgi:hypothetical protein
MAELFYEFRVDSRPEVGVPANILAETWHDSSKFQAAEILRAGWINFALPAL